VNHKRTIFPVLAGVVTTIACTALMLGPAQAGEPSPSTSTTTTSPPPTTPPPSTPPPSTPPPSTPPPSTPPPSTPPPSTPPPSTPPPTTTPPGQEGCTPGFWKNHPEAFAGTGYSASTTLGSVFTGLPPAYASLTFADALSLGGGGLDALLRQAVAALLNASSADVDYPLTAAQVIAQTNAAIASGNYETTKDLFDLYNNLTAPGFCD
jgi:hypothetical protein